MNLNINTNWKTIIEAQQTLSYWQTLANTVDLAYQHALVLPKKADIFKSFNYFNFEATKLVIIGQDPYPNQNDANGLAFSVNRDHDLPHSLINIFHELQTDLGIVRSNGDLSDWAKQGVLLLNSALTFSKQYPNFLSLWNQFTKNIIQFIDQHVQGVVFIFWGNFAKQYIPLIQNNRNAIISSGHPSFANVHGKFFNTKPFSRANHLLKRMNKSLIIW